MRHRSSRRLVAALGVVLMTATACGTGAGTDAASGTLRIAGPFEVHSLDPAADGEIFTRLQVVETLVTSDIEGQLAPALATTWTSSKDYTTWQFELVDEATFHDGTTLTADVVVAALEKAAAVTASPLADVPVAQMRAEGGSVVIDLKDPYFTLPAVLTHYSTAILAPAAYDGSRVTEVIGTGPYRIEEIELPAAITTVRSDTWRGEAPEVERVSFQSVSRAESRALMAVSDQADVVFGLEPAGRQRVDSSDDVRMESSVQPRTILMKVNAGHPILGDVRVRRALSLALDREAMADAVLREKELAATQLLPPSLEAWQADVEPLVHDTEGARRLLAEAGWEPDGDGDLRKDGKPLRLNLLTYPDRSELPALATAIQAQLGEIGVEVDVEVANSSEVPARHADGSIELALIAKHFALVSDPLVDVATVFAADGADWGVTGWSDPAVQDAVSGLEEGATGDVAQQLRDTIVRTAQEELPLVPVAWYRMNAAVSDDVEGFVMDPLETSWRITDLRWAS